MFSNCCASYIYMIRGVFYTAVKITLLIQIVVCGIFFYFASIETQAQGGKYDTEHGFYALVLSLQFFPFIFLFSILVFFLKERIKKRNR